MEEAGRIPKIYRVQTFACGRDGGGGFCGLSASETSGPTSGVHPCPSIPRGASRPRSMLPVAPRRLVAGKAGRAAPDARGQWASDQRTSKTGTSKKGKGTAASRALPGVTSCSRQASSRLPVSFSVILRVRLRNRPFEAGLTPDSLPLLTARARCALRRGRRAVSAEQLGASSSERAGPRRGKRRRPGSVCPHAARQRQAGRRGRSRAARKGPGCNPPARRGRGRC